ncbi:histidinol dehydrogenase [Nonlabens antarcticus]|uniref:histidinol dehydrogenase n=1 Tax=Nonlabens antarcticus TaxID=392714 RepID=UPI001890F6F1|nr:histidinol dehydrogenase [Nonlabens antarcticus]
MEIILNPSQSHQSSLLERPLKQRSEVDSAVKDIIQLVVENGDDALIAFAEQFDNAKLSSLKVTTEEIQKASEQVNADLKAAIQVAYNNIFKFHAACFTKDYPVVETTPGITCWRKSLPIQKVGLYIPGGSAPLFSTVLMLAIPAKIAGNEQVVLCSPTDADGNINPVVLYTANLCGVTEIYKVGGAQAIAAMTYGTESVPAVQKIFGPGNAFVTRAKELAQQQGVAIDMPAGPSEVLIIADGAANPAFVAADLLAQAEHGHDSQVILLTNSQELAIEVNKEIEAQIKSLSRKETAFAALENSKVIVLSSIAECIDWSDVYAPEHLIINTQNSEEIADQIKVAGSIFIGAYTCESLGDYASGTNHTLPTYGYARNYSGVSVDSFVNKVTYQKATAQGLQNLGPAVETMAAAEGLDAHKSAVSVRLKHLQANPKSLPAEGTSLGREKYSYETARKTIYGTLKERASRMRKNPTETEDLIWQELRNKKLGVKFRRQHIIDKYIVDFACIEKSIIVEIDGGIHRIQIDEDKGRQEFLESKGFEFLRFTDIEVLKDKEAVIESIKSKI